MKHFAFLCLCLVLASCGVKDPVKEGSGAQPLGSDPTLVPGLLVSVNKQYLARPSQLHFVSDPQINRVTYRFMQSDLRALPADTAFVVRYAMPEMPAMPVTAAVVQVLPDGDLQVDYEISMGGLWEFYIDLYVAGTLKDTFKYLDRVPE